MKIKPLSDRVVLEPLDPEEKSKGGIVIPDNAKEKPQKAKVVTVGPGKTDKGKRIPMEVKAGDTVLYGKYAGTEIQIKGKEFLIVSEDDILAKL